MKTNLSMRRLNKPVRLALVAGAATILIGAALELPAAAAPAPAPPYTTTTTITSSVKAPVTGQAVTFTATVKAARPKAEPIPLGTVVFLVTASDSSIVSCDAGNTVTLSGGTAQCSISGGLLSGIAPYAVTASYTDTVDSNDVASVGTLSQGVSPGPTTTGLTSSNNPTVTDQPVTFTATVAPSGAASGTLSGSVTFSGVTCDGGNTVAVSGGLAQCTISGGLDASGSPFTVQATYGSDPNFADSTSPKVHQTVTPTGATVVLASDPNTCQGNLCTTSEGTPVTFTATASGAYGTPTGSIMFTILAAGQKSKDGLTCDGGNLVGLSGGQASCTFAAGLSASIYYTVTATLVDPNYQSASAALYLNISLLSTDTTVSKPKDITAGETFPVTATVTALETSSNVPTGNVDITVCGGNSNGNNGCQGAVEPVGAGGTAMLEVGGGEFPGSYDTYATYLGDQNFFGSTAKKQLFDVKQTPTTITIASSENPSEGDAVTLTGTITAANGAAGSTLVGPPSGSLTFTITGGPNGTETCEGGNVVPLDNGQADEDEAQCYLPAGTLTDPAAPTGNTDYTVQVSYSSDGDYLSSHAMMTQEVVPVAV
jgi:hypothetical protein